MCHVICTVSIFCFFYSTPFFIGALPSEFLRSGFRAIYKVVDTVKMFWLESRNNYFITHDKTLSVNVNVVVNRDKL